MTELNDATATKAPLYMAMELGSQKWVLAFSNEKRVKVRIRTIAARELFALDQEIVRARTALELESDAPVRSCYEAGRDGFWVHRELEERGIDNVVVDAASMERSGRKRLRKTDRIDAKRLMNHLLRHHRGERVWSVCRVPTDQQEDERRNERELSKLKDEAASLTNAIKSRLALHGIQLGGRRKVPETFDHLCGPSGKALPRHQLAELDRQRERLTLIERQIEEVLEEREHWVERGGSEQTAQMATGLMLLKGVGPALSWMLTLELFGWREFKRGRDVGAAVGLTPTPHVSDKDVNKELGVSKTGPARLRAILVEVSWLWLRHQPDSELTQWFKERFEGSGKRAKRVGIVALARKLAIVLWRYTEYGEVPRGAVFKDEKSPSVRRYLELTSMASKKPS